LDRYKYPKKFFFEFFSSISWGLCTGIKGKKLVLFGFSIGTKGEKLNFYSSNILNSPLIPVLNPKRTTFLPLVPVQRPQGIDEKNFFWVLVPEQIPYFWTLTIFEKIWSCI
jgi:hypothetical protein